MRRIDAVGVCGYGCHLGETNRLSLKRLAGFLNITKPRFVIFSGAATQQMTAPGLTEAEVARDFVMPLCPDLKNTAWLVDTKAYTSLDNIRNFGTILTPLLTSGTFVIYGDTMRALKLKWFAKALLPWDIIAETYDRGSSPKSQFISTTIEIAMLYVPPLHWVWRSYRRWSAKRK